MDVSRLTPPRRAVQPSGYITSMRRPGTSALGDATPEPTHNGFRFALIVTAAAWFALIAAVAIFGAVTMVSMITSRAAAEAMLVEGDELPEHMIVWSRVVEGEVAPDACTQAGRPEERGMTRIRMTEAFVAKLAASNPPAKDQCFWDAKMPGFGIAQKGRSGVTSYVVQWRERDGGASHRLVLARCCRITLDAARGLARTRFAEIAAGRNPIAERKAFREVPLFSEFVAAYLATPAWLDKAPSTRCSDRGRINHALLPALGRLRLTEITQARVETLHRDLCSVSGATVLATKAGASKKVRRGGPGGARATIRLLSGMMAIAIRQKLISTNPCVGVEIGTDGKRTAIPDAGAYARLWNVLEELRATGGTMAKACDVVALIALTGARKSEVRLLRWRHLDLEARAITLPAAEHKSGRRTGKVRTIALSDAAIAILAVYTRGLPDALVFHGGGRADVAVDLARPWVKIKAAAGLPADICLHSLRHGVGSLLGDAGMSELQIASVLGHSSTRTTARYCHAGDAARGVLAQRAAELVRPFKLHAVG